MTSPSGPSSITPYPQIHNLLVGKPVGKSPFTPEQMRGIREALVDGILADVCLALGAVVVAGFHPFGFLTSWGDTLQTQASTALSTAETAQTTATTAQTNIQSTWDTIVAAFGGSGTGHVLSDVLYALEHIPGSVISGIIGIDQQILDMIANAFGNSGTGHTVSQVLSYLEAIPGSVISGITSVEQTIVDDIHQAVAGGSSTGNAVSQIKTDLQSVFNTLFGSSSLGSTLLTGVIPNITRAMSTDLQSAIDNAVQAFTGGATTGHTPTDLGTAAAAVTSTADTAASNITTMVGALPGTGNTFPFTFPFKFGQAATVSDLANYINQAPANAVQEVVSAITGAFGLTVANPTVAHVQQALAKAASDIQTTVDNIVNTALGTNIRGNPVSQVSAAMNAIPAANVAGSGGPSTMAATVQATWDAVVSGLNQAATTGNGAAQVSTAAANVASTAATANTNAVSALNTLGVRNNKPLWDTFDATCETTFPFFWLAAAQQLNTVVSQLQTGFNNLVSTLNTDFSQVMTDLNQLQAAVTGVSFTYPSIPSPAIAAPTLTNCPCYQYLTSSGTTAQFASVFGLIRCRETAQKSSVFWVSDGYTATLSGFHVNIYLLDSSGDFTNVYSGSALSAAEAVASGLCEYQLTSPISVTAGQIYAIELVALTTGSGSYSVAGYQPYSSNISGLVPAGVGGSLGTQSSTPTSYIAASSFQTSGLGSVAQYANATNGLVVPWIGFGISSGNMPSTIVSPQPYQYNGAGYYTTPTVPPNAVHVDVVLLSGGGGAQGANYHAQGLGGGAGQWAATTWTVGNGAGQIPVGSTIGITVGAGGVGGAGNFGVSTPPSGSAGGDTVATTSAGGLSLSATGGSGGGAGGSSSGAGVGSGNETYQGTPYYGGIGGASGGHPGGNYGAGGGGSTVVNVAGGNGSDGQAFVVFRFS